MKSLLFIVFAVFALNCLAQSEKNFIDQNYIQVKGKAEMEIVPDEIYLQIVVDEDDFKGKQEVQKVEKSMLKKLSELGVDVSKQLAVKDMASNFKKYWLKGQQVNATKEYLLKVSDAKTAGRVIQEFAELGVSNISIEKIAHSEIQKYRQEVKVNAMKAAKEKAASLTTAIGQKVGKAIYIEEIDNNFYTGLRTKNAELSNIVVRGYGIDDEMEMDEPEIEFEKIKLEYSILARFAIEE